jgi:large subunit ribosomal protein L10
MTREDKLTQIEELTAILNETPTIYLADIAALDATTTSNLRRASFGK